MSLTNVINIRKKEDLHTHAASSSKLEALQLEHVTLQEKVKTLEVILDRSSQEKRDLEVSGPRYIKAAVKATIHIKDNSLSQLKVKTFCLSL